MTHIAPTAENTRDEWDRVIGINLRGVWSCMKCELRQMQRQGSGAIVNNASVGALTGNPSIGSYIASKHGVVGLTRTAALEHTHPLGQTLIVTAGCGWAQREGSAVEEIRPGDVVWFAPNEKHWHGATPGTGMTHIAIQERLNGKVVDWMEHVTDEQYLSRDKSPH
jgi:NAD(P)-dependent dehydrogenase (short-subunit alcohol dehydrogenase family)